MPTTLHRLKKRQAAWWWSQVTQVRPSNRSAKRSGHGHKQLALVACTAPEPAAATTAAVRSAAPTSLSAVMRHTALFARHPGTTTTQAETLLRCLLNAAAGFAPVLAYCTSLGVTSIVVTPLPSPRYLPGLLPDAGEHSLAAACTAAVPWQQQARYSKPVRLQPPVGQQQQQQQQLESCSLDGSAVMGRTPLSSSAQYWHRLDSISGIGVLEPWMFMKKNPK